MLHGFSGSIALSVLLLFALLVVGCASTSSAAGGGDGPALRHIVMFKFKESASPQDIAKVVDAFRALPAQIPQIAGYEDGVNNSPEGLDKGFTHVFVVTFKSEADRAAYLPDPSHKAFVALIGPYVEEAMVLDYWVE